MHPLADEAVRALVQGKDIEVESSHEVVRDLESVLNGYVTAERECTEKSRRLLEQRSMPPSELGRIKRLTAEQMGIKIGDEMLDYVLDQCIEMLMHSTNVEEVYSEDHELRRKMRPVFRKYLELDEAIEAEVRGKLKHVKEGSRDWDVEYRRMMEDIQRRKGLV